jgi:hypothetical protein
MLLYEAANLMLTHYGGQLKLKDRALHQVPNERAENAGTRKRRHPEEASALDPLENTIRKQRPFPIT